MPDSKIEKVKNLPCWIGDIAVTPLSGGMTNFNFRVSSESKDYVVRLGDDIPEHLVWRENEGVTSEVAAACGFSPQVIYRTQGILVIDFIDGKVCSESDVRKPKNLLRLVDLLQRFHVEMPRHFTGYPILFWVFQVLRHYQNMLQQKNSPYLPSMPELMKVAIELEDVVGSVKIVFGHNDLLAANFIDDGEKIWLIDFDYAGFNSPLFDLANLASNSELKLDQEKELLENYFQCNIQEQDLKRFYAMKCASLLRETCWSMVSETYSKIDFDFSVYTRENWQRYSRALTEYRELFK